MSVLWSRTQTFLFLVVAMCVVWSRTADISVPRRRDKRSVEQNADIPHSLLRRRTWTSQFLVEILLGFTPVRAHQRFTVQNIIFFVSFLNRVQQRIVEEIFALGVSARASLNGSGVDEGAPTVMAAPSRTHGLSFTLKPQLMSASWRRTSTRKG